MEQDFFTKDFIKNKNLTKIVSAGEYTYGKPNTLYWNDETKLSIGKFCSIAKNVTFILGGNHKLDWVTTYPFSALNDDWSVAKGIIGHPSTNGNITIENDVWIGNGATILSGVKVENGAVIGANALVSKNVEAYCVVAGNPAKVIKKRFDDATINKLQSIAWWNWDKCKIEDNIHLLCSPNINKLGE